jgi:patatin-like phospholipase
MRKDCTGRHTVPNYEGTSKDYEFSRRTMEEHWTAGYNETVRNLRHPETLERPATPRCIDASASSGAATVARSSTRWGFPFFALRLRLATIKRLVVTMTAAVKH